VPPDGTVFAAGSTLSTDFSVQGSPIQTAKANDYAIFLQHLDFSQVTTTPGPTIAAVVNAASFATGPLSPGQAITITGTNLGSTASPSATSVSVNGQNIPLFYVSATQINGQLPFETPLGTASVKVTVNGTTSSAASIQVASSSPGVFLVGTDRAAATNPDGSLNTTANPASPGDAVTIYFTGIGPLDNAVATGAPAPVTPLSRATLPVTVTIGGQPATILYVGLTPGSVSLAQANVVIPNLATFDYPIAIKIGTATSNTPAISVAAR
jgi:uncharacterized protein (TIGR03437 family)